ncbi:MAG: HD domain-containing protein [Aldersonia sp.]|nr:HD domain-containing protein [Aldersonia sp.]
MALSGDELIAAARAIAQRAHDGQTDKAGEPYIGHPLRVAARVHTAEQKAVALLHDVLEDTAVTAEDLLAERIPADVVAGVIAMTKPPGTTNYADAIARAAADPLARVVKAADIADNSDEARLSRLAPEQADRLRRKYAEGRQLLEDATRNQ